MRNIICRVRDFLSQYIEKLQQSPQIIIIIVLLNLPYVIQHAFELQKVSSLPLIEYIRSILSAFLRTVFFAFLLDFLLKAIPFNWIRKFAQVVVLGLSFLLFLLDTFALSYYRCVVDEGMLAVLLATNPREASEFAETFVLQGQYVIWMGEVFFLLALVCVFLCYFTKRRAILIALLVVSFATSLKFSLYLPRYSSLARYETMIEKIIREKREYDMVTAHLGARDLLITKNESSIPYVVFVLGESTSRNHMSLYGYRLPTSPLLSKRAKDDGFYVFKDVISHHTQTSEVLEELFSFSRHQSPGHWFDYENVFDIAKAAGVHTVWISNQESFGVWGNVANHYADRCDNKQYTMIRHSTNERSSKYDEALFPLLDAWLQEASGKNLCVLHLLGTHYEYAYRYPASFDIFSEVDESGNHLKEMRARAEYDNAVRYNDFIVDEIIHRFEDKNAILIYVSDHAENVYDEPGLPSGHDEINANRYMAEIPMIIWVSPSFRIAYPDLERRIAESTDRPFMTDDMIHVLLDIMGIETKDYDPTKSVINEHFDASRVRIYGKNKDYEKERKEANAK